MFYRFAQDGDFVNFQSLDVFKAEIVSRGQALTAYGAAGVDFSLTDEQRHFVESIRDFCARECGTQEQRERLTGGYEHSHSDAARVMREQIMLSELRQVTPPLRLDARQAARFR